MRVEDPGFTEILDDRDPVQVFVPSILVERDCAKIHPNFMSIHGEKLHTKELLRLEDIYFVAVSLL